MRVKLPTISYLGLIALIALCSSPAITAAPIDDAADLMTQQAQEKDELEDMKGELGDLKSTIKEATQGMSQLKQKVNERALASNSEVHIIAKEGSCEIVPGVTSTGLTYNAQSPGPAIRVREGDNVRILLHNQMKVPTSMCFHGMVLPHAIGGLPKKDAGLVAPGQTYAFQFVAPGPGTYWYHPQVIHCDQMAKGLYGALVVTPARHANTYDRDMVLVLGESKIPSGTGTKTFYTVNGKSAPAIPPIEVHNGERIRLRVVNTSSTTYPLYLSGHKFEIVSTNGSDSLEPHVTRDTVSVQPGDRYDLEFVADNPGVWSLASVLPSQTSTDGKFPGGIAVVLRYPDAVPGH